MIMPPNPSANYWEKQCVKLDEENRHLKAEKDLWRQKATKLLAIKEAAEVGIKLQSVPRGALLTVGDAWLPLKEALQAYETWEQERKVD